MKKKIVPIEPRLSKHDPAFKFFLSEKDIAKNFLQEHLPSKIALKLDFNTLQIVKDTFVDKKLSRYYSDILYEIKFRGKAIYIDLLFDHKSKEDRFMGFQFLKYKVRIWEYYFKQHKNPGYLPVIIPIVIYNGASKWKTDTQFISLLAETQDLEDYIPDFRYLVYDISHLPDEELKGSVILKIILLSFKYSLTPTLREKLPEIFRLFRELENKSKATEYLEVLLKYFVTSAKNLRPEDIEEAVTRYIEEGGVIMQTIAEKWMEQGKLEGVQQGMQQGMQQGTMKVVKKALEAGLSIETIALISGISADEIRNMQTKIKLKRESVH